MHSSTVTVSFGDGGAAKGKKVEVSINGAFCKAAFTDNRGVASIQHDSTGAAKVYVNGSCVGQFQAPGSTRVRVR
ncbi:MAG: hypothetical protein AAF483_19390 [Planctomycetota bacterium]